MIRRRDVHPGNQGRAGRIWSRACWAITENKPDTRIYLRGDQ